MAKILEISARWLMGNPSEILSQREIDKLIQSISSIGEHSETIDKAPKDERTYICMHCKKIMIFENPRILGADKFKETPYILLNSKSRCKNKTGHAFISLKQLEFLKRCKDAECV